MVDRRPGLIARCTSADDVVAAIRHGRDAGLEIAVKCGGHSVLGLSVPEGGLMIDLAPIGDVRVDAVGSTPPTAGSSALRICCLAGLGSISEGASSSTSASRRWQSMTSMRWGWPKRDWVVVATLVSACVSPLAPASAGRS